MHRHVPDAVDLARRIAGDPKERAALEAMKPVTGPTAEQLAAELKDLLADLRGTPQVKANRARLRRIWSDPVLRAEFLAQREKSIEATRRRPRRRGRWLPDPKPSRAERIRRQWQKKRNWSTASASRFKDPAFRARVADQLAAARTKIRRRQRDARGHFLPVERKLP